MRFCLRKTYRWCSLSHSKPRIILFETQYSGNIGSTCRAMGNLGFDDLRIVHPAEEGWRYSKESVHYARTGLPVLAEAAEQPDLLSAVSDIHFLVGTGQPKKFTDGIVPPHINAEDAMRECVRRVALGQKIGIVFGNERCGLPRDALALCDAVCSIPYLIPGRESLNLSQAALMIMFLYRQAAAAAASTAAHTAASTNSAASTPPWSSSCTPSSGTLATPDVSLDIPISSSDGQHGAAQSESNLSPTASPSPLSVSSSSDTSSDLLSTLLDLNNRSAVSVRERAHFVEWVRDLLVSGGFRGTTAHEVALRLLQVGLSREMRCGGEAEAATSEERSGDDERARRGGEGGSGSAKKMKGSGASGSDLRLLFAALRGAQRAGAQTEAGRVSVLAPGVLAEQSHPHPAPKALWRRRLRAQEPSVDT